MDLFYSRMKIKYNRNSYIFAYKIKYAWRMNAMNEIKMMNIESSEYVILNIFANLIYIFEILSCLYFLFSFFSYFLFFFSSWMHQWILLIILLFGELMHIIEVISKDYCQNVCVWGWGIQIILNENWGGLLNYVITLLLRNLNFLFS